MKKKHYISLLIALLLWLNIPPVFAQGGVAFFNVPEAAVTQDTLDEALALDGVEDVNMNRQKKTLAVTFFNDETTADKLQKEILEILNK